MASNAKKLTALAELAATAVLSVSGAVPQARAQQEAKPQPAAQTQTANVTHCPPTQVVADNSAPVPGTAPTSTADYEAMKARRNAANQSGTDQQTAQSGGQSNSGGGGILNSAQGQAKALTDNVRAHLPFGHSKKPPTSAQPDSDTANIPTNNPMPCPTNPTPSFNSPSAATGDISSFSGAVSGSLLTPSGKPANPSVGATGPLPFGDKRLDGNAAMPVTAVGTRNVGHVSFAYSYPAGDSKPRVYTVADSGRGGMGTIPSEMLGWDKAGNAYVKVDGEQASSFGVGSDGKVYANASRLPGGVTRVDDLNGRILKVKPNSTYDYDVLSRDPQLPPLALFNNQDMSNPKIAHMTDEQQTALLTNALREYNTPGKGTQLASTEAPRTTANDAGAVPGKAQIIDEGDGRNYILVKPDGTQLDVTRPNPNAANMFADKKGNQYIVTSDGRMTVRSAQAAQR